MKSLVALAFAVLVILPLAGCREEPVTNSVTKQQSDTAAHTTEIQQWQTRRAERLQAEDGWLSLIGLFWLKEGPNPAGSKQSAAVVLPAGMPPTAGTFVRSGRKVTWQPADGSTSRALRPDSEDVVKVGRVTMSVVERGRLGVRVRDPESPARKNFQPLDWYPIDPAWRIRARFIPAAKQVTFAATAGGPQKRQSPGYVEWTHKGRKLRLTPVTEGTELFWVFRDRTAGKTTYPAARFLYTDLPKDGHVVLDFNKAYNPPCVFTPYATCPLPPPENRLPVEVTAGEKLYRGK